MKTLIGIDLQGAYKPALSLVARLAFAENAVNLAHVVDPTLPYPAFELIPIGQVTGDYVQALNATGEAALAAAKSEAANLGVDAGTALLSGPPTAMLIGHAEATGTGLLAVGAVRKGTLGSLFLGSMSRALAAGAKQSILVGRGDVAPTGPLKVVFATDHSEYARVCLDLFLAMRPAGLDCITFVTAFDPTRFESVLRHAADDIYATGSEQRARELLEERSRQIVAKVSQQGIRADFRLEEGSPGDVIPAAMSETDADLLVLGAHGHGFVDRLFMGSVSFHQVAAEPYPVLILRA